MAAPQLAEALGGPIFTTTGAVLGLAVGLFSSIVLILISPSIMGIDGPEIIGAKRRLSR